MAEAPITAVAAARTAREASRREPRNSTMAAHNFDAVNLRRGRYAAAQLWKLTSVRGVRLDLSSLIGPFIGDVHSVLPRDIAILSRRLGRLAVPREIPRNIRHVRVRVFADEVSGQMGLPVAHTTMESFPNTVHGVLPHTAGIFDYFCVEIRLNPALAFEADWEDRFGVQWPLVRRDGHQEIHPALVQLWMRTVEVEGLIVENNERRIEQGYRQQLRRLLPPHLAESRAFVDLMRDTGDVHP